MPKRRELIGMTAAAALLPGCAATAPLLAGEQTRTFTGVIRKSVEWRYLVWMPEAADRPAAGWPLLIFLHGSGERGTDLARVKAHGPPKYAAAGRRFPFVLVAPQLPEERQWDPDAIEALRADLIARGPIDPDRVLLTGMSLGGHGTWDYAVEYPDRLAAIAPVCGSGVPSLAMRLARLPVWSFHGALDDVVPIAPDRLMIDAVRAAGGRPKFTVYPDVGHNAWDPAYADPALYDWLLAQRRGQPARG
ncbi:dienelactone hydrolase family protein [Rhizobacter sp. Root404]|jgi:predicted peptidase|uniref:carboxylesterase family protein n=1 Tax=Rhizobacter sp. Root404 TaxID=1736528 RepID=UPI000B1D8C46|nr:dienelactone hydrolase family protein [Rhizobacter sp. Root404]